MGHMDVEKVCLRMPLCCCGDIIRLLPRSKGHVVSSNRRRSSDRSGVGMSDLRGVRADDPELTRPSLQPGSPGCLKTAAPCQDKQGKLPPTVGGLAVECDIWAPKYRS